MGGIFSYNSPYSRFVRRLVRFVWLNFLTLIFCLPVITVGASLTAAHRVLGDLEEGGGIAPAFWHAFCADFKNATCIYLPLLALSAALVLLRSVAGERVQTMAQALALITMLISAMVVVWSVPLTAHYNATIPQTVRNAVSLGIGFFPTTLLMIALHILPVFLLLLNPGMLLLLAGFGVLLPVWVNSKLSARVFQKIQK